MENKENAENFSNNLWEDLLIKLLSTSPWGNPIDSETFKNENNNKLF